LLTRGDLGGRLLPTVEAGAAAGPACPQASAGRPARGRSVRCRPGGNSLRSDTGRRRPTRTAAVWICGETFCPDRGAPDGATALGPGAEPDRLAPTERHIWMEDPSPWCHATAPLSNGHGPPPKPPPSRRVESNRLAQQPKISFSIRRRTSSQSEPAVRPESRSAHRRSISAAHAASTASSFASSRLSKSRVAMRARSPSGSKSTSLINWSIVLARPASLAAATARRVATLAAVARRYATCGCCCLARAHVPRARPALPAMPPAPPAPRNRPASERRSRTRHTLCRGARSRTAPALRISLRPDRRRGSLLPASATGAGRCSHVPNNCRAPGARTGERGHRCPPLKREKIADWCGFAYRCHPWSGLWRRQIASR
jgi:hypothetical protein